METLSYLSQLLSPAVPGAIALGTSGGPIIGALPGLTATMGVALLIPLTFGMTPVMGINMLIGIFIGIVPGTGSGTASWITYNEVRRASKCPEKFGTGYAPGIAATESANNAVCAAALIPLLALGIPGDVVTAVLMGGLMIPRHLLSVAIVLFCFIGSFAINLNPVDLYTMVGFGVLGWGMQKFGVSQAALCIALILGPMMESNLCRGLLQTHDNLLEFASGPITQLFVLLTVLSLCWPLIARRLARRRSATSRESESQ